MKNKITLFVVIVVLVLAACKSDDEKQAEKKAAIAKKTGSTADIPRVFVAPDIKREK